MLILTRKIGETVVVGDDVFITILGVKGSQVRLGIDAPKEIAVYREEIHQQIKKERGLLLMNSHKGINKQSTQAH